MISVFLKIMNMGMTASYCILLICAARLFLKNVPKIFSYLIWIIVAVRLICPFGIESRISLIGAPSAALSHILPEKSQAEGIVPLQGYASGAEGDNTDMDTQSQLIYDPPVNYGGYYQISGRSEIELQDKNPVSSLRKDGSLTVPNSFQSNIVNIVIHAGAYVWFGIMLGLLIYCIASYLHLKRKLNRTAVYAYVYKGVPVYLAEGLETPFVLGIKKAFIYLPASLTEQESSHCLAHEYTHICRRDHLIKFFAFCLGCVYWFNPLVWLAFHLMTKDMEMSCDEMTLKGAGMKERKTYSEILLQLSSQRQCFAGYPLAFGENNVTSRIKNILKRKKTSFVILLICTILTSIFAIALLTDPVNSKNDLMIVEGQSTELDKDRILQAEALAKQAAAQTLTELQIMEEEFAAQAQIELKVQQASIKKELAAIQVELQELTEQYEKIDNQEEKNLVYSEISRLLDKQNSLESELNSLSLTKVSSD